MAIQITEQAWAVSEDPREGMEWNTHIVLAADYDNRVCFMANGGEERAEEFAKAALLIAAAPDMAEALRHLLHNLDESHLARSWTSYAKARAALAKARGEG